MTDTKDVKKRRQTGENDPGVAVYDGLASGTYRVHQGYPKGVDHGFILDCASDTRDITQLFTPIARIDSTGSIKITIEAPETITCNWFNIPDKTDTTTNTVAADSSSNDAATGVPVTITVLECANVPNPLSCSPAGSGFGVALTDTSGTVDALTATTGDDGIATVTVPAGTYSVKGDQKACLVTSASMEEDGSLTVDGTTPIDVRIFICSS